MMPAAKHGDMQVGVDIHLCTVPTPVPTPMPLPTPHMSVVFDPFDYIPYIGATVTVMGMKRATAGTNGIVVHIPPGFPFAPKLPEKDDELFMGSATVVADGDPMSHISHPVLACQVAGMASPFRPRKKGGPKAMVLPTVFNLAIPSTVFLGGPPTISMTGMAMKGAFAGLGRFARSGLFKRMRSRLFGHMKPGFLKCVVLRAEPVNILSGAVSVEQEDFVLPGRIALAWRRTYRSDSDHVGLLGRGWETVADTRLEVDREDGSVLVHGPEFGLLAFDRLPAAPGGAGAELELADGSRLAEAADGWCVRTKEDRVYHFPRRLLTQAADGTRRVPIGRISDRCGNALDFEYQAGRPVAIADGIGRRLALTLDDGRLRAVTLVDCATRTEHRFVGYEVDADGDLAAVVDALGAPYRFAYERRHMVRHTDRNGLSFHYAFDNSDDSSRRVVHAWGDGGLYDYRFEYQDRLGERRITDSLGQVSLVKLDDRGLPISEIDPLGGMTIYEYDDAGRTTAVVDPAGRRTEYGYDDHGNLLKLSRPDGTALITEFDAADKPVRVFDALGHAWQQRFDTRGLMVEQVSPLGHVSRYDYDAHGQLVSFTNARGARTGLSYDGVGQLTQRVDALGHATLFAYDTLGNVVAKGDALDRRTEFRYDAKSRLVAVKLPSGSVVRCGYDAEDNLAEYADENGAVTRLEYFGQGAVARRRQPDGHVVEYLYDTEERLVGVRNQRGELYALKRDALGRIVEEVDYWGQSRRYGYDGSGHLVWSEDPLRRRIDYACDPLGHIVRKAFADPLGGGTPFEDRFAYDANGNLVATSNAHVEVTREFDAEGRMIEEVQAHAAGQRFVVQSRYDEAGNRTRRVTDSGAGAKHSVEYAYDLLDQAVGIRIDDGAPMRMQRDAVGQITEEEMGPGLTRRYRYNADGLMTEQRVAKNGKALFATRYEYDWAGNLTQRHDSQFGIDRYVYDPMGRVLDHIDPRGRLERFFNDPAGDRLVTQVVRADEPPPRKGGTADPWHRDGEYLGVRYRFDRAGNLTRKVDADVTLDLAWDSNQRLVASRRTEHGVSRLTTYAYDPLGRRLFKSGDGRKTWFGWDQDALACEFGPGRVREFVYRADTYVPITCIETRDGGVPHARPYFVHPNGQPDPLRHNDGPLRLQGQYDDEETGLAYNRHRYFSIELSAYVSADPLGLAAGTNLYGYGPNEHRWTDPLGLACSAGKHFKDHFIRHKALLEMMLGKKYSPWKKGGGAEFLRDIDDLIATGRLVHVGEGTLKAGHPPVHVFRGGGVTAVIKPGGEFVTLLESGKGMDTAIQMLPGAARAPGSFLP